MWKSEKITQEITKGSIFQRLRDQLQDSITAIPQNELPQAVEALLCRPQPRKMPYSRILSNVIYAAQYFEVFKALDLPDELAVYEPCAGGSDPVILAAEAYSSGKARYLTVNLNRKLREELQGKIGHLKSSIHIIDDNAQNVLSHFGPDSVQVACFHHAINDILQTAISEPRGMDTATIDWWPNERQMLEWLGEDFETGHIERRGKKELMEIIANGVEMVRPGGYLVFDHWASLGYSDMDWFPWKPFYDLVPITRQWIAESDLPVTELHFPDVDPQWWMFFSVEKRAVL